MNTDTLKRLGIWGGIALALGLMVWGLAVLGAKPASVSASGTLQDPLSATDHTEGSAVAKNVLVEYSDFQCPACGSYYPLVKQIAQTYGGHLLIVYRYFPLTAIHPNAELSAQAAEAAARQGKFWEMHNMLFDHQRDWSGLADPTDTFIGYATQLGLNKDQFVSDLTSAAVVARVRSDLDSGARANVNATPTFYLNGNKLTNLQTYGDLEQDIQDALK